MQRGKTRCVNSGAPWRSSTLRRSDSERSPVPGLPSCVPHPNPPRNLLNGDAPRGRIRAVSAQPSTGLPPRCLRESSLATLRIESGPSPYNPAPGFSPSPSASESRTATVLPATPSAVFASFDQPLIGRGHASASLDRAARAHPHIFAARARAVRVSCGDGRVQSRESGARSHRAGSQYDVLAGSDRARSVMSRSPILFDRTAILEDRSILPLNGRSIVQARVPIVAAG